MPYPSDRLMWLSTVSWKVEKCNFQPQKVPMDILEKNETKVMHRIIFRASNTINGKVFQQLLWQQCRVKMAENLNLI